MTAGFDCFILLAEMRTGSNLLEDTLNRFEGVRCWGEAFNPHFMGHAGKTEMAGLDLRTRDGAPERLLDAMRARTDGLAGFRFFHDHDPRVLRRCLDDWRCAKIMLHRNPLDSYVSLAIARQTGQWRLGDLTRAKTAKVTFDPDGFSQHLGRIEGFRREVLRQMQVTGQTMFHIGFEDLGDLDILNGLAAFLGIDGRLDMLSPRTKVQNPGGLRDKVVNYDEMRRALADLDPFGLDQLPNFEPRRGPAVPSYVRAARSPLLFLPVRGGPEAEVTTWLAALDAAPPLTGDMSQKTLRKWKRQSPGHRCFTAISHPVVRIHDSFCRDILAPGSGAYRDIRTTLRARYDVPLPEDSPGEGYGTAEHRRAFIAFLTFVKGNLNGQTSIRVQPAWASQSSVVQGFTQMILPDLILRADRLDQGFRALAEAIGARSPATPSLDAPGPVSLDAIYDDDIEAAVREIYRRDYLMFGFGDYA